MYKYIWVSIGSQLQDSVTPALRMGRTGGSATGNKCEVEDAEHRIIGTAMCKQPICFHTFLFTCIMRYASPSLVRPQRPSIELPLTLHS